MFRKGLLVLILTALIAGSAFAKDKSAGMGVNFVANFDSYTYDDYYESEHRTIGVGLLGFWDTTYMETNLGLLFGSMNYKESDGEWVGGWPVAYLTLGFYGKYPMNLIGFDISPMIGIQLDISISSEMLYMSRFWIKFGASADYNLTDKIYLRPLFLYGFNINGYNWGGVSHGLDISMLMGFRSIGR